MRCGSLAAPARATMPPKSSSRRATAHSASVTRSGAASMGAAGASPRPVAVGDWTSDSGYDVGRTLPTEVTAVFAANDRMALGLIHALAESGIRVPQDVSVVGFDDVPDARHFLPPLTTVRQDFRALGRLSVETLLGELEGLEVPQRRLIEPELVVRASTAPPRSDR